MGSRVVVDASSSLRPGVFLLEVDDGVDKHQVAGFAMVADGHRATVLDCQAFETVKDSEPRLAFVVAWV